jgi:hypothetical protein
MADSHPNMMARCCPKSPGAVSVSESLVRLSQSQIIGLLLRWYLGIDLQIKGGTDFFLQWDWLPTVEQTLSQQIPALWA